MHKGHLCFCQAWLQIELNLNQNGFSKDINYSISSAKEFAHLADAFIQCDVF